MFSIPCVIFAGGKSSRMEEDKALLPFGGYSTLTEYQYQRLSKIFKDVYISTKTPEEFPFKASFIVDAPEEDTLYAPTNGFISAMQHLQSEAIFIISVDTPFISKNEITQLLHADTSTCDATIAKTPDSIEPMCGVYHLSLLPKFLQMKTNNSHKLGQLLKNSQTHYVTFNEKTPFLNLNYPHEYQEALRLLDS
ncbi:MAG: molybdenum cofactor guanylyltransferase MobA [Campylobacterales bacterium]|nr:molybdenum cofactor guanylyltransferase MobA [Campylobacterales bacterium]